MDDSRYLPAFQIIMNAGNSKSASMLAVEAARTFQFELAQTYLTEAETEMRKAHMAQIEMVQKEAAGEDVDINIILVHAQDHLAMAIMAKDHATEMIYIYKMLSELRGGKNEGN